VNRAYSTVEFKAVDDDQRIIEGIASSPLTDRVGDVLEPKGAEFRLPLPLLWQHRADEPIGHVISANVTDKGIQIRAQIAKGVLPRIDEIWSLIKSRLVRGLSVGFRPIKDPEPIKGTYGLRFTSWEWMELSAVTIPANTDATILTVKQFDIAQPAASGTGSRVVSTIPGVTGSRTGSQMKTIQEQITAFEATRQAKSARMTEIMTTAGEKGETLDEVQSEEYDGLDAEVKSIDAHLVRLRSLEQSNRAAAVPVAGTDPKAASESRSGVITVKSNVPPGTAFTRYAMALAASRGSWYEAAEYAKKWESSTPEVLSALKMGPDVAMRLKAAVDAGNTTDTTWAAPLVVYQNLSSEFIELLRPATIIGRINGFRRVPFNVTMPAQTSGSTVGWRGQGKPKPVGELAFEQKSLGIAKAAGIIVLTEELVRSSSPSAEAIVRQDLIAAIAQFLDEQFVDPAVAAVANVSPASITNGATVVDSTGTNASAFRTDLRTALGTFTGANISAAGAVLLMTEEQALAFSLMQNALGQSEFPNMTATGGSLAGFTVVASESIPAEGGSPAGNRIILLKPSEILLADDGGVALDVSREASVQMNTSPDDPATASTVFVNFWQNNLVGLRAERFINWLRRRTEAVVVIEGAVYTG
jgi:HK97 family phage major capsid protein/HK97 family phage prohead protease